MSYSILFDFIGVRKDFKSPSFRFLLKTVLTLSSTFYGSSFYGYFYNNWSKNSLLDSPVTIEPIIGRPNEFLLGIILLIVALLGIFNPEFGNCALYISFYLILSNLILPNLSCILFDVCKPVIPLLACLPS